MDKLDLHSFKYGGVNITGFRLPLANNPLSTTFQEIQSGARTRYGVSTLSVSHLHICTVELTNLIGQRLRLVGPECFVLDLSVSPLLASECRFCNSINY